MKKITALLIAFCLVFSLTACSGGGDAPEANTDASAPDAGLKKVTVCLDYTPNTNHTGLFVAQSLGYYAEKGLDVTIIQPPEDGAVAACAAGQAQFAVDFQDWLAAAFTSDAPIGITAVAALCAHNTSGIMSLKGQGMDRPGGLEGNAYLTWNSPIELAMVKNVVEGDGGDYGKVTIIPNTVTDEAADVTANPDHAIWVYSGWGLVNARIKGVETDYFSFRDINPVFDYYTPVLVANNGLIENDPQLVRDFLAATAKGYEYAVNEPEEAARILIASDTTRSLDGSEQLVTESQKELSAAYIDDSPYWGYIDAGRWDAFYDWLSENGLVEKQIPHGTGFTNDFLPGNG
ncbi:MAG: ABC transporter substrate-binding protein [Clostridia bacterium]|nr:ABC transporter substrate-binding protein [Clostridia bacterium]